jgi:TM2 domain-containing membrane protein YozV
MKIIPVLVAFFFSFSFSLRAGSSALIPNPGKITVLPADSSTSNDFPFFKIISKPGAKKKLTAAVLAFPLPFGIFGGHRIYLGSKPVVPLFYIATAGGCFGILPFIDFCVILLSDGEMLQKFENNDRIFMWAD